MKLNKSLDTDASIIRASLKIIAGDYNDGTIQLSTLEMVHYIYSAATRIEKDIISFLKEGQTAETAGEIIN